MSGRHLCWTGSRERTPVFQVEQARGTLEEARLPKIISKIRHSTRGSADFLCSAKRGLITHWPFVLIRKGRDCSCKGR